MLKNSQISQKEKVLNGESINSQEIIPKIHFTENKNNKIFLNKNMPVAIYNTCLTPNQSNKDFSVKIENSLKGKIDMNRIFQISPFQENINNKMFQSQNLKNSYSDLHTSASFNSQKSAESFFSHNNNKSQFIPTNFALTSNNNFNLYPTHRKVASSVDYPIDLNNNYFYRNNLSSKGLINLINNTIINQKTNQNLSSINLNDNNTLINNNSFNNLNFNNVFQNNINCNSNYFNTQKSVNFSEQYLINNDLLNIDSINHSNSNNINIIPKNGFSLNNNNSDNQNRKKSKNYYNKFNTSKENNINENTVILTLKVKVAKNDYRIFNLKKYDDLFVSLEKFVDINKIKQELVKPLVSKIFKALNKIFYLLNNKIGIYDQEYLNSLYRLWIKNNREIPRNKAHSDKSTTNTSSDSSSENSYKDVKSNSFQNTDGNSSDEKERQHTSKSF